MPASSGSAMVPAAVPRPAESFQRGEGQGEAAEDHRGAGAWRGRSSLSVLPWAVGAAASSRVAGAVLPAVRSTCFTPALFSLWFVAEE